MANRTTAKASVHHCKRRLLRLAMVLLLLCCFGSRAVRSWTATHHPFRSPCRRPFSTPLPFQSGSGALCAFSPPCARETPVHRLPEVRRVFCISDLHVDHPSNMEWLEAWSKGRATETEAAPTSTGPRTTDLLVVAGDISHDPGKIEEALLLLRNHTEHVVFVPGNHEAWLSSSDELKAYDEHQTEGAENDAGNPCCGEPQTQPKPARYSSIEKLEDIERLCRRLGVFTTGDCVCVGGGGALESEDGKLLPAEELWILPMDGWYDGSLSFVDPNPGGSGNGTNNGTSSSNHHYDLVSDFGRWPWVDFLRCRWPGLESIGDENEPPPPPLLRKIPRGLVGHFVKRNQGTIDAFRRATTEGESFQRGSKPPPSKSALASVLTVSHFLPNRLCLPDWKDLSSADFDFDSWLDHGAGGLSAKFALVAGSDKLDQQIRSIPLPHYNNDENSDHDDGDDDSDANNPSSGPRRIHVFGHSHRPKDFVYGGIRYVHNPLGKPRERELHMVDPEAAPKLVWEAIPGECEGEAFSSERAPQGCHTASSTTIIRYWEEKGGGLEMLRKRMEGSKRRRRKGPKN